MNTLRTSSAILALLFFFSCNNSGETDRKTPKADIPEALKPETATKSVSKSISSSRGQDVVEALYQELVDKTPALKNLEDEVNNIQPDMNDLKNKFGEYDNKSIDYYRNANYKATNISDSMLKRKLMAFIAANQEKYAAKTEKLHQLFDEMGRKETSMADQHTIMKVVLTMPMIEQYQKAAMPDQSDFMTMLEREQKIMKKEKGFTTGF